MAAASSGRGLVVLGEPSAGTDAVGIAGNRSLEAEGWQRRYLADEPRAREALELYDSLGYEVRAEPLEAADFGPRCGECSELVCRSYVLIYTRKRARQVAQESSKR